MKYQIEDIKEGVEFIIDDDQTFDELIEFYLPFRHSELSSLDPSKPGDYDSDLNEKFFLDFTYKESPDIYDWAYKTVYQSNWHHAVRLYVALATYADKNKADRVLALDLIYCLIGLTNNWVFDGVDGQSEMSRLRIAKQVLTDWGEHEVTKFLVDETLEHASLTNLELDIQPYYFGILSDLFGADLYFDAVKTYLEEEDYIGDLVDVVQLSLEHLDNDKWAREIYKNYLERHKDSIASDIKENGIHSWGAENIITIAESIAKDLNDKKWEEEIYMYFLRDFNDDEIKKIKDEFSYLFKNV